MYVTLEPCSHTGRTPPCVDAIIDAGVAKVVIGAVDPDHRVSGAGSAVLEEAGIAVEIAEDQEARDLDPGYFTQRETGLPLITLKYAMTLDGSVAASDGSSQWISGPEARADAHRLRSEMDAVMVGAGTFQRDDPQLDVRHVGSDHQPQPVIVAGTRDLPVDARLWDREPLVISAFDRHIPAGEMVVVEGTGGIPSPEETAKLLARRGLYDILLEGGPRLATAYWQAGLIARGVVYVAGKIGGGRGVSPLAEEFETIGAAKDVAITEIVRLGNDLRIEFK